MGVVISMLRGINLARHHRIKMDALRALYESLDLREPQTYVQSGNVIFKTRERNLVRLAARIEEAFERAFQFHSDVILRTSSDLRDVIAKNPCRTRQGIHPSRLLVFFLVADPGDQARESVLKIKTDPEELWIEDRHLYIYYPDGMARPKLSWALLERTLKTPGTGRNWNSVTKLLELAEKMEGS
jgi:uncharacterized protein (DUF1697 family)